MSNQDVDIWMPIYIGDMLAKTTRMTTEQIGASFLLMMDYWRNGAIPDDNNVIASVIRSNLSKAKALKTILINSNLFEVKDSELSSKYLDDLKSQAESNKSSKSERAKKAAEARWNKEQDSSINNANTEHESSNANAYAQAMHKHDASNAQGMLETCPSSSPSSIYIHTQSETPNSLDEDLSLWKPSLHEINSWRQRAGLPKTTQEEFDNFMITFLPHYAPEIRSGRLIENKIYAKYIQWAKDDALKASRLAKSKPAAKTKSANDSGNVNDAWNNEPKSDDRPFTGTVHIPEDLR
ncbi:TPA: DUF1376 domain-containing protein [Acinetobacter nosocomialis]|nr:DUF1376 domain-containing protein [Acinetobacter nosocomialis]